MGDVLGICRTLMIVSMSTLLYSLTGVEAAQAGILAVLGCQRRTVPLVGRLGGQGPLI